MSCCREEFVASIESRMVAAGLKREALDFRAVVKGAWENLPKGWTEESAKKFWSSLTGDRKHKITSCIKQMTGKVTDPGAFCGSLASRVGYR